MSVSGRASAGRRRSEKLGVWEACRRFCRQSGFFFFFFFFLRLQIFLVLYVLHSDSIEQDELVANVPDA